MEGASLRRDAAVEQWKVPMRVFNLWRAAACFILLLGTGCRPNPSLPSVVGCYEPVMGPIRSSTPTEESGGIAEWIMLDSAQARLPGTYRLRMAEAPSSSMFVRGWWRWITKDSIEVRWATPHAGPIYRLHRDSAGLAGRGYIPEDPARGIHGQEWIVNAKRIACTGAGAAVED